MQATTVANKMQRLFMLSRAPVFCLVIQLPWHLLLPVPGLTFFSRLPTDRPYLFLSRNTKALRIELATCQCTIVMVQHSDENKMIRIAKCDVFSGVCESIR